MDRDFKYLNAFNSIPGIGTATLRRLKNNFGTFEAAWHANEPELQKAEITSSALRIITWKRPSLHPDRELEKLVKERIWTLTEENFPSLLKEIPNRPLLLYGKGNAHAMSEYTVFLGVVGTRKITNYGLEATERIVHELCDTGIGIVSGLALGVDARAHQAAVDSNGVTVAVLGSGLDHASIYPRENKGLARRIIEAGGALVSEYPPPAPPLKEHFPQRNRIISGLSRGVLVIEAKEKSGALITARFALEQNREVFAIPGSIFSPTSRGPNLLIQEGAKLVLSAGDILEELGIEAEEKKREKSEELLGEKERFLYDMLEEPLAIAAIKERTGLDTSIIVASLSMLELKGLVRNIDGETYQKV